MKASDFVPNEKIKDIGMRMTNRTNGIIRPMVFCTVSFFHMGKGKTYFFITHQM